MPETTTTTQSSPQPTPLPTLIEALRNPSLFAARRAEYVQLASERATKLAADARTRFASARTGATARAQELRKASNAFLATALGQFRKSRATIPVRVRGAAHDQLQRAARALQDLANRIEPCQPAPEETTGAKPTNGASA